MERSSAWLWTISKEGIGLRGYGQKDPLVEYKKEAFDVFAEMTSRISTEVVGRLFKIQVQQKKPMKRTGKADTIETITGVKARRLRRSDAKKGRQK